MTASGSRFPGREPRGERIQMHRVDGCTWALTGRTASEWVSADATAWREVRP